MRFNQDSHLFAPVYRIGDPTTLQNSSSKKYRSAAHGDKKNVLLTVLFSWYSSFSASWCSRDEKHYEVLSSTAVLRG